MHRFLAFQWFPAVLTAVLFTSCGGESGGTPSPPPPTPAATHFSVTAPASVNAGTAFNFTVTALDASNTTVSTYSGTLHFTSTDTEAALPADSTLMNGTGSLLATLETVGSQTLTATDPLVPTMAAASKSIQVSPASTLGFTATGSMLTPRESHTATLLPDGRVLVAGGVHWGLETGCPPGTPCMSVLDSTELFNPAKGVFTSAEDMGAPRVFHTATLLGNGSVLIAGGDNRLATVYQTAKLFDPTTGLFTSTRGNMTATRTGHTATLLADGKVLLAGGSNTVGNGPGGSASAELYDPTTGKFTPTRGNMKVARSFHSATLLSDGTVLLVGGDGDGSTAEIFTPGTGLFALTGSLSVARPGHSATLLLSGEVLVAGGQNGGVATATTELYNPLTRKFSLAQPMLSMREGHTATQLADGKVLVIGGVNRHKIYSSAELYDPKGAFTLAGNMETVRFQHAATWLANGEVLVTGGDGSNLPGASKSLGSAELSAIGTHPGAVTLSPQAIFLICHFGVGGPAGCSPPWLATLTNSGTTPVYLIGVAISPARVFFQTNDCPQVLAPAQFCKIAVSFDGPGARDQVGTFTYTGTLYVSDTASGSAQKVMLTGITTVD
jgi:hypothetical protein